MADEMCDNSGGGGGDTPSKVVVDGQKLPPMVVEVADDKNKSPRHPRWTRQETLTLIEGKKVAENRGRRGRRSSSVFGSDQVEPKWDSVASYCKQHGVNRGPVQCRKRWSNMVGDFKKIKAWESQVKQESDSYWLMRNDLRKENKLPGFFDQEVFDVLDGKAFTKAEYKLALVTVSADTKDENGVGVVAGDEEEEEEEGEAEVEEDVVFDSGRRAVSDDGLFPDSDKMEEEADNPIPGSPDPMPISEKRCQTFHQDCSQAGTLNEQQTNWASWKGRMPQEGCKRRRVSTDELHNKNFNARLIEVLEKNVNSLNARLEAENTNCQLERDERKDYNNNLVSALNRISDALTKIADKL
ncbi:trihelix transcription factor ASR3 isoform X1 [Lactuca sativa]|uniref:trihelix transcription factor ASR3 isoform X1 n=1 Tax=Lactuca sativa TaxID=4236 RepID=UPI001C68C059|nr:trihelix transcription factor ASR3 isoform X1 [Lactuca sativa]